MSEPIPGQGLAREFHPVTDPKVARKLLKEGATHACSAMIWTKEQEYVIHSRMTVLSESHHCFYAWIPASLDPRKFYEDLVNMKVKDCFFSVSLPTANIFFKTTFLGFDHGGLRFWIPEKIFRVQRRKDVRFPIPDGRVIKVEFGDPLFPENKFSKKIVDISAGGLAFFITEDEDLLFLPGMLLKGLAFTVNQRTIEVDAEVRHKSRIKGNARHRKGIKIGVQFRDIRPGEAQHIASYVFEESRKYFSKFAG